MAQTIHTSDKNVFKFKQFSVDQGNVAMRVNTDGVLLGAYAAGVLENAVDAKSSLSTTSPAAFKVLDIGTGTGVIALMIAQRLSSIIVYNHCVLDASAVFNQYSIDAIDIEEECYNVAAQNFAASPWSGNLRATRTSLQEFTQQKLSSSSAMRSENYDLIVSNPPYFNNSLKNPSKGKAIARHTDSLSYKDLVSNAVQLLKDDGMFAVIISALEYENFLELAHRHFLYEREIVRVYSKHSDVDAKRVILLLAKGLQRERIARKIYLEEADRTRSAEYGALTKDYYL